MTQHGITNDFVLAQGNWFNWESELKYFISVANIIIIKYFNTPAVIYAGA